MPATPAKSRAPSPKKRYSRKGADRNTEQERGGAEDIAGAAFGTGIEAAPVQSAVVLNKQQPRRLQLALRNLQANAADRLCQIPCREDDVSVGQIRWDSVLLKDRPPDLLFWKALIGFDGHQVGVGLPLPDD